MAINVTTYHYDNARTGWNPNEVRLTPQVVSDPNFGVLFEYGSDVIDDVINAQPLYMHGVLIAGVTFNVVFVVTRSATVYAFDADRLHTQRAGQPPWLWKRSLVNAGVGEAVSAPLLATPVIDTAPASGHAKAIMYVVGRFRDKISKGYFRLHALDVTSGNDVVGLGPTQIDRNLVPTVSGSGDPQTKLGSGEVFFDPLLHYNRPALLLANDTVYVAFGSQANDTPPYHGWVMGFRTKDLRLVGSFCTTPDGTADDSGGIDTPTLGGSVWQAGFGPAADNDGFIYCMTGNGLNDLENSPRPRNYADSLLQIKAEVSLTGSFTPPDPLALTLQDTDFGSAGPLVLPNGVGGGNFAVGCGKDANVYLVDRVQLAANLNQVGKFKSTIRLVSNPLAPSIGGGTGPGVWGGPAYYDGGKSGHLIYYCGSAGPLQALAVANGSLTPALTSLSVPNQTGLNEPFANEGGIIPVVSSNGSTSETGVVWGIVRPDSNNQIHLRAYDAADLTKGHLFEAAVGSWAPQNAGWPYGPGAFLVPVIADGKVYVGSDHRLTVYGVVEPRARGPIDGYATATTFFNNQQHVNFIGTDNHVHELFFDGTSWHDNDLTHLAHAQFDPAPGSALDGYQTPGQQHVNYIGTDNHVHELFFDGTSWHDNNLTAAAAGD